MVTFYMITFYESHGHFPKDEIIAVKGLIAGA